jgi:hypothetical protein
MSHDHWHGGHPRHPTEPYDARRLAALMSGKLERSPEPHTASFGPLPAFAGPGLDERPLEFGEASEDRQHQHPMRRGGTGHAVVRPETMVSFRDGE